MLKMNFVIRDVFRLKGNTVVKWIFLTLGLTVGVLAFKLPPGIEVFAAGTIITLLVILMTVTVRSYGAATANPVKSLKTE